MARKSILTRLEDSHPTGRVNRRALNDVKRMAAEFSDGISGVRIDRVDIDHDGFMTIDAAGWGMFLERREHEVHIDTVRWTWNHVWRDLQTADLNHAVHRDDARLARGEVDDDRLRDLIGMALAEIMDDQRREAAKAAALGLIGPLSTEADPTIAHVVIDEDLGRMIVDTEGDAFLTDLVRRAMIEGYDETLEVLEGEEVAIRLSVPIGYHDNPPYVSFHGDIVSIVDIETPETIVNSMTGRALGEIVPTGSAMLDARIVESATLASGVVSTLWIGLAAHYVGLKDVGCRPELVDGSHPPLPGGSLPAGAYDHGCRRRSD